MQDLQNIFTTKNIIIYFILINIIGFLIMYIDKQKAKKGKWRIPEKTLFIITALGGGIGTIAGMCTFRHKTQKVAFVVGFPVITILEIICIIYFKFWVKCIIHYEFVDLKRLCISKNNKNYKIGDI